MKFFAILLLACLSGANAAGTTLPRSSTKAREALIAVKVTRFDPELCTVILEPKGKTFVLRAETKSGALLPTSCQAGFRIVPTTTTRLRADSGASDIPPNGVRGSVAAGAGLIDIGDKWSR